MKLQEFENKLFEVQRKVLDIKVSSDQKPDTADIIKMKNQLATETAKVMAPLLFNFVQTQVNEIASKLISDLNSNLNNRIKELENNLNSLSGSLSS